MTTSAALQQTKKTNHEQKQASYPDIQTDTICSSKNVNIKQCEPLLCILRICPASLLRLLLRRRLNKHSKQASA
jgi:hypothetical protein